MILTPRAHNPTGCSLSARRAAALQNILARYPQVVVIIDDHFALLSSSPWQPVIAQTTQHWAVIRSVSKTLGPDLRLAVVASDSATSAKLRLRLNAGSQWVSHLLQDLVYACLTDPEYQHRLAQTRLFLRHPATKTGLRPTAIWHRHFSRRRRECLAPAGHP